MLRRLADQNLHGDIVRALFQQVPELDLLRLAIECLPADECRDSVKFFPL